jgi:hypothetical protein
MKHIKLFEEFVNEASINIINNFNTVLNKNKLDVKVFKEIMPKTAKTIDEATKRIQMFDGKTMFVNDITDLVKYRNNRDESYKFVQEQYWLNDKFNVQFKDLGLDPKVGVNVTLLSIYDTTDPWEKPVFLGKVFVDTKTFLDEMYKLFEVTREK